MIRAVGCKVVPALRCAECKAEHEHRVHLVAAINAMFKATGSDEVVPETEDEYYRFVVRLQESMDTPISSQVAPLALDTLPSFEVHVREPPLKRRRTDPGPPASSDASSAVRQLVLEPAAHSLLPASAVPVSNSPLLPLPAVPSLLLPLPSAASQSSQLLLLHAVQSLRQPPPPHVALQPALLSQLPLLPVLPPRTLLQPTAVSQSSLPPLLLTVPLPLPPPLPVAVQSTVAPPAAPVAALSITADDAAPAVAAAQRRFALHCAHISVLQLWSCDHAAAHRPGCAKNGTKECRFKAPHAPQHNTKVELGMQSVATCCVLLLC